MTEQKAGEDAAHSSADQPSNAKRLDAPAYHRNIEPLLAAFQTRMPQEPSQILEIGCGTGQHVTRFAKSYPQHVFWPTDFAIANLESTRAWLHGSGARNVCEPKRLNASQPSWPLGGASQPPANVDVIFSANVIHISPWTVAEGLFAGAGHHLTATGKLMLYGPFQRDGAQTAPSNEAFDQWLKNQDQNWGIRDLDGELAELADTHGLVLTEALPMPANNFLVSFARH